MNIALSAMHMANELLTAPVALMTIALAAVAVALAARVLRSRFDPERLPLIGVMGAFVFAGQMINFTLPGMPGTGGHLGGGVLLAILLGPAGGILTMTAILIIQCLLFQDGGLLALGCNIINMGVVPCLVGWGLYRAVLGPSDRAAAWRQYLAAWAACVVGVTAGAAMVPVEAGIAGVLRIDMFDFLAVMIGVHLLIGLIEGFITFAVLAYLRRTRPSLLSLNRPDAPDRLSRRSVLVSVLVIALLLAGIGSWFASTHPDGLEWSYLERAYGQTGKTVENDSAWVARVDALQESTAPLPDYANRGGGVEGYPAVDGWGSLAGVLGTVVTLAVLYLVTRIVRKRKTSPQPLA